MEKQHLATSYPQEPNPHRLVWCQESDFSSVTTKPQAKSLHVSGRQCLAGIWLRVCPEEQMGRRMLPKEDCSVLCTRTHTAHPHDYHQTDTVAAAQSHLKCGFSSKNSCSSQIITKTHKMSLTLRDIENTVIALSFFSSKTNKKKKVNHGTWLWKFQNNNFKDIGHFK